MPRTPYRRAHCACASLLGCSMPADRPDSASYSMADFTAVRKFDSHTHVNSSTPAGLLEQAERDGFEILSINVDYPAFNPHEEQYRIALELQQRAPQRFHFAATFSMEGWGTPGWSERATAHLRGRRCHGARAVKVWKNIGMSFRDSGGQARHARRRGLRPGVAQDRSARRAGDRPSRRAAQLLAAARPDDDRERSRLFPRASRVLHVPASGDAFVRRPDRRARPLPGPCSAKLRFVGAHLASLEWSVDELAALPRSYPQAVVDMAARMTNVQAQSSEHHDAVREFFIRYQDRMLYATDLTQSADDTPAEIAQEAARVWRADLEVSRHRRITARRGSAAGRARPVIAAGSHRQDLLRERAGRVLAQTAMTSMSRRRMAASADSCAPVSVISTSTSSRSMILCRHMRPNFELSVTAITCAPLRPSCG